jgi:HD-like signal output (HDOD) protein
MNQRALNQESLTDQTRELIAKLETIKTLPTLPTVIQKLRTAIINPASDAGRIARIIQDDPAMIARVLRVVNSVLYGGREPISSLQLAVSRLGFNAVSNIAMSTAVFTSFGKSGEKNFDRRNFWRHCIATGVSAVVIHEQQSTRVRKKYTQDFLHLCGLLHDVGKIVLEQHLREKFMNALIAARETCSPLVDAERDIMGSDHSQIGAWLGIKWILPRDVLDVIRWHHDPKSASPENQDLVMLCHLANYVCNLNHLGDGGDTSAPAIVSDCWSQLGLAADSMPEIVEKVAKEMKTSEVLMTLYQ